VIPASASPAEWRASEESHGQKQQDLWVLLQAELTLPTSTMCTDGKVDAPMKDK